MGQKRLSLFSRRLLRRDPHAFCALAIGLAESGNPEAFAACVAALRFIEYPSVDLTAVIDAFASIRGTESSQLLKLLSDDCDGVRVAGVRGLSGRTEVFNELVALLDKPRGAEEAVGLLSAMKTDRAEETLRDVARNGEWPYARARALWYIALRPDDEVRAIVASALSDDSAVVRAGALKATQKQLKPDDLVTLLGAGLLDDDPEVRSTALKAISSLPRSSPT